MCQPRECGRAECGSEVLRMYIKIDAFTKRDLPTHVPRETDRNSVIIGERVETLSQLPYCKKICILNSSIFLLSYIFYKIF